MGGWVDLALKICAASDPHCFAIITMDALAQSKKFNSMIVAKFNRIILILLATTSY